MTEETHDAAQAAPSMAPREYEPPPLRELSVVTVVPGQRLLLKVPETISRETAERLKAHVREWWGGDEPPPVLVLDSRMDLLATSGHRPGRVDELLEANNRMHERVTAMANELEAARAAQVNAETGKAWAMVSIANMANAMVLARDQFAEYERLHRAKGTPDADRKADVNRDMAAALQAVMDKNTKLPGPSDPPERLYGVTVQEEAKASLDEVQRPAYEAGYRHGFTAGHACGENAGPHEHEAPQIVALIDPHDMRDTWEAFTTGRMMPTTQTVVGALAAGGLGIVSAFLGNGGLYLTPRAMLVAFASFAVDHLRERGRKLPESALDRAPRRLDGLRLVKKDGDDA